MGMGNGSADLPFDHPCTKSEKYPARITIAVTYYGGEMAELLKMQGDAVNQQILENAMSGLKEGQRSPMREKLGGGEIVYVAYETECQPETIDTGKKTQYPPTPMSNSREWRSRPMSAWRSTSRARSASISPRRP